MESSPRRAVGDSGNTAAEKRAAKQAVLDQVRQLHGSGFEMAEELQRRRFAAAKAVGIDLGPGLDQVQAERDKGERAAEAEEEQQARAANKQARLERRAKQQAEANAGGLMPLTDELAERLDTLRSDQVQRSSLAKRVRPDRSQLAAQMLKQVHAVHNAAPTRRHELLRERAQRREATRAEVAGRLRAALPGPPEPPRVDSARTPRIHVDPTHLTRYRNAEGGQDATQKQRIRSLAADIGRMLF